MFIKYPSKLAGFALLATIALGCLSCSYSIHQQYIGSMDPDARYGKGKWVSAETSDFVILGFARDTNYVERAYEKLEQDCKGRIAQVTTEHLTAYKFLSYDQKVILRGLCI